MQADATIEALLVPVDTDNPCGENLRYDDRYAHLFDMPKYEQRQDFSGARKTEAVEAPAWSAIASDLRDALARTRDLRLLILQLRVWSGLDGLEGVARGFLLIHGGIERYWDQLHPELDTAEPDPDLKMIKRLAALRGLVDPHGFIGELRRMPLVDGGAFGKISLRQIDMASGRAKSADSEESVDAGRIEAAFRSADPKALGQLSARLTEILRYVEALHVLVRQHIKAADDKIDFARLIGTLQQMRDAVSPYAVAVEIVPETEARPNDAKAAEGVLPMKRSSGAVTSRDDVICALDDILRYYRNVEPSSPIPLLLERTKRLVRKDFIELIEDLAPSAMNQVLELRGVEVKEAAAKAQTGT